MTAEIGTLGTIYHCSIDGNTFKITGAFTAERVTDPADIAAAKNVFISNWRNFHVVGDPSGRPAGDHPPPIQAASGYAAPPAIGAVTSPASNTYQDGSGDQNMKEAKRRLMSPPYNLTNEQASAFIGNWMHESNGGFADINQGGIRGRPNTDMGGSGYGFGQWTGPRKIALVEFCTQHHLDVTKFDSQWQYMTTEPQFNRAVAAVRGTHSLYQATQTVEDIFEGIPLNYYDQNVLAMGARYAYAQQAAAS
jgi:hypothetical protein